MKPDYPALVFEGVTVSFPGIDRPAVSALSFELASGDHVALLGLNGSGKTTLLQAAVGLVDFEGMIHLGGEEVTKKNLASVRRKTGFLFSVPEDQLLFPKVVNDVAFGLIRGGIPAAEAGRRARTMLRKLDAHEYSERPPHQLSHGQRLRVALAGALVTEPILLLLDEPSAGLDPPGKRRLARYLAVLPSAMLIATHDLPFARNVCSRYLVLEEGRLVQQGEDFAEVETRWNDSFD